MKDMKERYKLIPEVFFVLFRDEKVLLGRRTNTGYNDGNYGLPGGHGENRETIRQGIVREAKEELGLDVMPDDLELLLVQSRWCADKDNPHARVGFYFAPRDFSGEPKNMEPEKCDDLQFFALDELPENIVPHIKSALTALEKGRAYDEFDWETLVP
ncbi:MAG: NUDIX domain-containing protein [Patescibacteria group bacterium]